MALPRNDSSSIISSLQMDYGDSDEEENDSKNNSVTSVKEEKPDFSNILVKMETTEEIPSAVPIKTEDHNSHKETIDTKLEPVKTEQEVRPVDFISDDEDDSQKHHHHSHHHHRHHHHRRKSHHNDDYDKVKTEESRQKDLALPSDSLNTDSPASQGSVKLGKKATVLVSYGRDEDVGSEDEESGDDEEAEGNSNGDSPVLNASDASILSRSVQNMSNEDIKIPPEPPGKCPYPLQRKIEVEYQRMVREGVDHNRIMQEKKSFRNPSIYEKLIEFCHIDENGTNFPPEIYNPHVWGKESFYDELDKVQRKEMEKREKDKKERTKIEFMTGTKKPASATQPSDGQAGPDEKKRKTKWDAQPGNIQVQYTKLPTAQQNPGVVNLTAMATGTKGKVISAVGSLSKKPSK